VSSKTTTSPRWRSKTPGLSFETRILSFWTSVGFIESEGMKNGWMRKVLTSTAMMRATSMVTA
jgi:hypothetical protein